MPSTDRRYSEDEVRAIFQETARRQASLQASDSPGLTLDELMAVARETGMDPALVAAAAAHVGVNEEPARRFWDVPDQVRDDRVLPGTLTDEVWEQIVDVLRRTFGETGSAGQAGRIREWTTSTTGNAGPVHVEVRPEGDQTRVSISQSLAGYRRSATQSSSILATTGVALSASILIAGGLAQLPVLALVASLMFGMAFIIGFGLNRSARAQHAGQQKRFEAALDRIDLLALRRASPTLETAPPEIEAPEPPIGEGINDPTDQATLKDYAPRQRTRG